MFYLTESYECVNAHKLVLWVQTRAGASVNTYRNRELCIYLSMVHRWSGCVCMSICAISGESIFQKFKHHTQVSFELRVGALQKIGSLHQTPLLAPQSASYSVGFSKFLLESAHLLRLGLHPCVGFGRHTFTVPSYPENVAMCDYNCLIHCG